MSLSDIKLEDLPRSLQELGKEIGLEAVLKLAEHYGGVDINPPKNMHDGHPLAMRVGLPAARYLASYWGGDTLYIPKLAKIKQRLRNAEIVQRYDEGESVKKLAFAFKLTSRTIWNVLKVPVAA